MSTVPADIEALGLLEIDGMARALRAQDAALKRAPCRVLACAPVSPGKVVLVLAGEVAVVEESMSAAEAILESRCLSRMFLPGVHRGVIEALHGARAPRAGEAMGILELSTTAATLELADLALKTAGVRVGRLHLASGFGGRGYFTLLGAQSEVEAALAAVLARSGGESILDHEVIAAPHDELELGAFKRPWSMDPADGV